jgi:hypothetical protein
MIEETDPAITKKKYIKSTRNNVIKESLKIEL